MGHRGQEKWVEVTGMGQIGVKEERECEGVGRQRVLSLDLWKSRGEEWTEGWISK